jgi:RNA polymerase sigma-70 factor (ECF subfamily)
MASTPERLPQPDKAAAPLELALKAAQGDLQATQALLSYLSPIVRRVVAGVLGTTHAEFDDVAQQSLIAVLGALPSFRGECSPAGYASRIAFRVALRARRRRGREQTRLDTLARSTPPEPNAPSPVELNQAQRRRELLRDLLSRIPEEQAETLTLRVVLGWSLDEIAETTGAPTNTVRSRMRLAKEALRKSIECTPDLAEELGVGE